MSNPTPSNEITIDQIGCARCCGDGHPGLTFKPFTHPFQPTDDDPGYVFTHWAPCPSNGEPIFLVITEKPEAADGDA